MTGVFLSHASADKPLVDEFFDSVLRLGLGLDAKQVFYSSGSATGVPSGEDLNSFIRKQARQANLVIAMITPEFIRRPFCLAELGAAWASTGALFPLLHPALERESLDGVLSGVMVSTFDDPHALDELHDRIADRVKVSPNARSWSQYKQRWLDSLANGSLTAGENDDQATTSAAPPAHLPGAYQWGEIFEGFVDAALYIRDEDLARTTIERHIRAGTLIPSRYHYSSDSGADNWLRLCAEPTYGYHIHTTEFWADARGREVTSFVLDELGTDTFDFVSLGPGDGQKDADIVTNWLESGADVLYYPYDVSLPLASRAVQQVRYRATNGNEERLRVKAVLADFRHFVTMQRVFAYRETPNVIALLGSLGNLDRETGFLRELQRAIGPDDLVLIEVRLQSDAPELTTTSSLEHDFGPLAYYLGLEYDADAMSVERRTGISAIPETETVMIQCRRALAKGQPERDIRLQYIHLYDPVAFLATVAAQGYTVLHRHIDKERAFLTCVLRRSANGLNGR